MARLREALEEAGFSDVRTHLQSGNVVLSSKTKPEQTARKCERLIEDEFGFEIDVVVRTPADLARVVKRNPLGKVAKDPKRYQVSFLAGLPAAAKRSWRGPGAGGARCQRTRGSMPGTPAGVALEAVGTPSPGGPGVTATARNWSTVTKLLELADRWTRADTSPTRRSIRGRRRARKRCSRRTDRRRCPFGLSTLTPRAGSATPSCRRRPPITNVPFSIRASMNSACRPSRAAPHTAARPRGPLARRRPPALACIQLTH
jgi:hypothetical protein